MNILWAFCPFSCFLISHECVKIRSRTITYSWSKPYFQLYRRGATKFKDRPNVSIIFAIYAAQNVHLAIARWCGKSIGFCRRQNNVSIIGRKSWGIEIIYGRTVCVLLSSLRDNFSVVKKKNDFLLFGILKLNEKGCDIK